MVSVLEAVERWDRGVNAWLSNVGGNVEYHGGGIFERSRWICVGDFFGCRTHYFLAVTGS